MPWAQGERQELPHFCLCPSSREAQSEVLLGLTLHALWRMTVGDRTWGPPPLGG